MASPTHSTTEDDGQYMADLLDVKYGSETIATYKDSEPGGLLQFDCGAAMTWLTNDLWLAIIHKVIVVYQS
jgi:hypothetical protein